MSDALTYKFQLQDAVKLLNELQAAEQIYRSSHDLYSGDDIRTGRAWDKMRRAGDRARAFIEAADLNPSGMVIAPHLPTTDGRLNPKISGESNGE